MLVLFFENGDARPNTEDWLLKTCKLENKTELQQTFSAEMQPCILTASGSSKFCLVPFMIVQGHITTSTDCASFDCGRVLMFSVVGVKPCLGLVLETVLVTQRHFHYWCTVLHRAKAFSAPCPMSKGLGGCTRSWEVTQPGQLTSNDQRDIPDHKA